MFKSSGETAMCPKYCAGVVKRDLESLEAHLEFLPFRGQRAEELVAKYADLKVCLLRYLVDGQWIDP